MRDFVVSEDDLGPFFGAIGPVLDERGRRVVAGAVARMLGHGGIAAVGRTSGVSKATVNKGAAEVDDGVGVTDRVRAPGGGRKPVERSQPGLAEALDALVEPETRGDPMCALRWTTKSTRNLAQELAASGFTVSHMTIRDMLVHCGYSLQGAAKVLEGSSHPDRDAQFRYLGDLAASYMEAGEPVVSVDTKKKELIGQYNNPGVVWRPKGEPVQVADHDFPDPDMPKAVPYGIYDLAWVALPLGLLSGALARKTADQRNRAIDAQANSRLRMQPKVSRLNVEKSLRSGPPSAAPAPQSPPPARNR
jgi:hypothetical protein